MAEYIVPLLRTVFLPPGSPGIGVVQEIKADIGTYKVNCEQGIIYCAGEADLLIDYISYAEDIEHEDVDAGEDGGKQWQALLTLPFEIQEAGVFADGNPKVTVNALNWFLVGERAVEMEMELKIADSVAPTHGESYVDSRSESMDEPEMITSPAAEHKGFVEERFTKPPLWTMVTIDQQAIKPLHGSMGKKQVQKEGWQMVDIKQSPQTAADYNRQERQTAEDTHDAVSMTDAQVAGMVERPAAEMVSQEKSLQADTVAAATVSADEEKRQTVVDVQSSAVDGVLYERHEKKEATAPVVTQDIARTEEKIEVTSQEPSIKISFGVNREEPSIITVKDNDGEEATVADTGEDSVGKVSEAVAADVVKDTEEQTMPVAGNTAKIMDTEDKNASAGSVIAGMAETVSDKVNTVADTLENVVAEAATVAGIVEKMADAASTLDKLEHRAGPEAAVAAAAVVAASELLPKLFGGDKESAAEQTAIEISEEVQEVAAAKDAMETLARGIETLPAENVVESGNPAPLAENRKRRRAMGLPNLTVEKAEAANNGYAISIKK